MYQSFKNCIKAKICIIYFLKEVTTIVEIKKLKM